jgi:hypothetical protein
MLESLEVGNFFHAEDGRVHVVLLQDPIDGYALIGQAVDNGCPKLGKCSSLLNYDWKVPHNTIRWVETENFDYRSELKDYEVDDNICHSVIREYMMK